MPEDSCPRACVITILNLKGGVGKTHASWLLASVCQERGKRILLIDLDTQGNLSGSFLPETDRIPGVEMLFNPGSDQDLTSLIRHSTYAHLDIVPASAALAHDKGQWGNTDPLIRDWHQSLMQPDNPNASCCGEADAYWADEIHVRDGKTASGSQHTIRFA